MKLKISVILFLAVANIAAQEPIQFLKFKNADRSVDISVKNNSDLSYHVTIKMELEGMSCTRDLPISVDVKPNSTLKLAQLLPTSEQPGKYLINYRVMEIGNSSFEYEPNITIYTKNKDTRSTQLMIYLNQNGIAYNEINTSYNGDTHTMYMDMLKRRGIDKKDAKLPVVIYRGEVYPDIQNVKKFCKQHFADEGHFVKKKDRRY